MLARELGVEGGAIFGAYTGKACKVLADKGCPNPQTLHSMLYVPIPERDKDGRHTVSFCRRTDSPLCDAPFLIVDEVSMVDGALAADLLSYGCRVLVIGDPAQLPPVGGGGFFTNREPDWWLTEVHRQARESGVLRMATDVRETGRYVATPGHYGSDVRVTRMRDLDGDSFASLEKRTDQIIVGTNARRHAMNALCRQVRGFTSPTPEVLDKIVRLRNDKQKGLQNGGLYRVDRVLRTGSDYVVMTIRDEDDRALPHQDVVAHLHHFLGQEEKLNDLDWSDRKMRQEATYGYAITCHKAQGSAWENVVVVDESKVFRKDARAWLYTALTRASKTVTLIVP